MCWGPGFGETLEAAVHQDGCGHAFSASQDWKQLDGRHKHSATCLADWPQTALLSVGLSIYNFQELVLMFPLENGWGSPAAEQQRAGRGWALCPLKRALQKQQNWKWTLETGSGGWYPETGCTACPPWACWKSAVHFQCSVLVAEFIWALRGNSSAPIFKLCWKD